MNRHFLIGGVILFTLVVSALALGGNAGVLFDAPSACAAGDQRGAGANA